MTLSELLARAVKFDAGPLPTLNNWILYDDAENDRSAKLYRMAVVKHGDGWCVTGEPMMHLDPVAGWVFPTLAHHFESPGEAFDFIAEWKAKQRAEAETKSWMKRWVPWKKEAKA